tara:strand:+ start:441 stop:2423 length:1983 start_codon:yes stop_codon:yes gene_type:complete
MEFGWIEKIQKNKALVIPIKGKKNFLSANRIAFSWKDNKLPPNASMAHKSITKQVNEAKKFKNTLEIETMHSLLDVKEYSLDELSENFLDDPKNSIHKLGLFFSLRDDLLWFKHNRNLTYTPRTKGEIRILKIQLLSQEKMQEKKSKIQKWIKQLDNGKWVKDSDLLDEKDNFINELLNLLIEGSNSKYWKEMSTILDFGSSFGINEEKKLKKWLKEAGSDVSPSRLILLRANVRENFEKTIYPEVERLKSMPLVKTKIIPHNVPTFTIDSEKTFDYDDAFSILEWDKKGLKIAIHITDISYYLNQTNPVFKEAEIRISSVYTVEDYYPMIPKDLSNGVFSLKSGEKRNVLSFFFRLSNHGEWHLLDINTRSIIVQKNLSYTEANKLIKGKKDFWDLLYNSCLLSQKNRVENGALNIFRKEYFFDIRNPDNIKIILKNRNNYSNCIVQEMAISVNSETGKLFQKSNFPGIFRTQSSYEIIKPVEDEYSLSMENVRINPTKLTTVPAKHASLGCQYYMQVTSPIRRFSDLIMQLQLKLLLKNKNPIFTEEDMTIWSEEISTRQKKYKRAEIEILNSWKILFLQQNLGATFEIKTKKKLANGDTEIEVLELDLIISAKGLEKISEGEKIFVKINRIDKNHSKIFVKSVENISKKDLLILERE